MDLVRDSKSNLSSSVITSPPGLFPLQLEADEDQCVSACSPAGRGKSAHTLTSIYTVVFNIYTKPRQQICLEPNDWFALISVLVSLCE